MMTQNIKFLAPSQGSLLTATPCPKPTTLQPTEVLIHIHAIAINPADVKSVDQGQRVTSWPLTPGLDGAGIIDSVGHEVTRLKVGERVLAQCMPGDRAGSYQRFAVVEERMVAKIPDGWSFEEAASLPVCYFTAVAALGAGLKTGLPFIQGTPKSSFNPSSILVLGGSSALGAATIQLLRLSLPESIILATSSPKHHKHITTLGVSKAIDRSSPSIVDDIKSATLDSQGVDAILDVVGAAVHQPHIFEAFKGDGPKHYAQVWTGDEQIQAPKGVTSVMFRSRDLMQFQGMENIIKGLEGLLADGKYQLPLPVRGVGEGLDGLKKGLDLMREGVSGEKLVATVKDVE